MTGGDGGVAHGGKEDGVIAARMTCQAVDFLYKQALAALVQES